MKRMLSLTATTLVLTLGLAACGSEEESSDTAAPAASAPERGGAPAARPGSGKVAAVDGSTAQVQGSDGQTAVTWTSSTTFTQEVAGKLSDVTEGACVLVMGEGDDDAVTATTVRLTEAVDGECRGMGGPGGRGRGERPTDLPSAPPGDMPDGRPSDAPSGAPGGRPGGMVMGTVTAVSSSGFTVEASAMPGGDDARTVTVTVDDDTTFRTTADADSSAVEVGACVQTEGEADSTGAVTATSISVSEAQDGECTGGFGGRPSARDEEGA